MAPAFILAGTTDEDIVYKILTGVSGITPSESRGNPPNKLMSPGVDHFRSRDRLALFLGDSF